MRFKLLILLAVLVICSVRLVGADQKSATPAPAKPSSHVRVVTVEEFDKLRTNKTNIVLDVRTANEFKSGHIPGATNIDYNARDFGEIVAKLDKNKTYLIHCAVGMRSARACKKMEELGFTQLFDLHAGFNGWEEAGKPVEK